MNDDPIIKCSPGVISCRYHVLIKQNESQRLDLMTFWPWLQKSRKTDHRKLDFMTFWPWLKKSTKLVPRKST